MEAHLDTSKNLASVKIKFKLKIYITIKDLWK
jgi:hypothetical protein